MLLLLLLLLLFIIAVLGQNQSDVDHFKNVFGDEFFGKVRYIFDSPVGLKDILKSHSINSIRSCYIFLDGAAILGELTSHYKDLLRYARDNVGKSISLK